MSSFRFYITDWWATDVHDTAHDIQIFGKTPCGSRTVRLHVRAVPRFYFTVSRDHCGNSTNVDTIVSRINSAFSCNSVRSAVESPGTWKDFVLEKRHETTKFAVVRCATRRLHAAALVFIRRTWPQGTVVTYESDVDTVEQLMRGSNVPSVGYVDVTDVDVESSCDANDIELRVARCDCIRPVTSCMTASSSLVPPPLVFATFDIEVLASDERTFPDASVPGDSIICICTSFYRIGEENTPYRRHVVALGPSDEAPTGGDEFDVVCFTDNEGALLSTWADEVMRQRTDVLQGYNIWGFDLSYILDRANYRGCNIGLMRSLCWRTTTGSGGAYATGVVRPTPSKIDGRDVRLFATPGIAQMDVLFQLRRLRRLDGGYRLEAACRQVLGSSPEDGKTGMTIERMHHAWKSGTPEDRLEVLRYCMRDADLAARLSVRVDAWNAAVELATACCVPLNVVTQRGQGSRVSALVAKHARTNGMLLRSSSPSLKGSRISTSSSYQGATVLEPVVGAYFRPVCCLDFQSLYPSIIIAHNLCHSTIITGTRPDDNGDDIISERVCDDVWTVRSVTGVLPALLRELANKRQDVKRQMSELTSSATTQMMATLGARQLAYKLVMNSVYGLCGATHGGSLACRALAAAVTSIGRTMIGRARDFVQLQTFVSSDSAHAPQVARVLYGDTDSLMVDFATDDVDVAMTRAIQVARAVTALFDEPCRLCFEKCFSAFLLYGKKRYVGRTAHDGNIECRGVQLVRGDTCAFVKDTCTRVLNQLLVMRDEQGAREIARDAARRILSNRVDLRDLSMRKTVRASAAALVAEMKGLCASCGAQVRKATRTDVACERCGRVPERTHSYVALNRPDATLPAHVRVACLMEERCPGSGPGAGDVVEFVYVQRTTCSKLKASDLAEEVTFAIDHAMRPAAKFYVEHQLSAVQDLFDVFGRIDGSRPAPTSMFDDLVRDHERRAGGQRRITDVFAKRNV